MAPHFTYDTIKCYSLLEDFLEKFIVWVGLEFLESGKPFVLAKDDLWFLFDGAVEAEGVVFFEIKLGEFLVEHR